MNLSTLNLLKNQKEYFSLNGKDGSLGNEYLSLFYDEPVTADEVYLYERHHYIELTEGK